MDASSPAWTATGEPSGPVTAPVPEDTANRVVAPSVDREYLPGASARTSRFPGTVMRTGAKFSAGSESSASPLRSR